MSSGLVTWDELEYDNPLFMGVKTAFVSLEGSANALAINKDATQVVVAGRNVFKVFSVESDRFVEKLNLRVGKNLNLNFSCADVVWNPIDDALLATAATNGSVVTWNLNKTSHSKQDIVFHNHKRTVNKVCFHNSEAHLLLSGSQDGTMKMFDLRKKEATSTFYSLSESVRDVQFCPHQYFIFAAVQENGHVQLWDLRRTDRCERQFTAHSGPVYTCDWHPDEKKWLATAGRDRTIKVWDISTKPFLEHCIQTMASVSRVKWRPQRKYNIASSSLVVDFTVNVWDIRRPYVPFASFNEHKDVTTGFAWRNDPHALLTTSKDCTLYQHSFRDAIRPADNANPVGLDISPFGEICYAASEKIFTEFSGGNLRGSNIPPGRFPAFFRKPRTLSDQFQSASSVLLVFSNVHKDLSMDWFIQTALNYQLCGKTFSELCDHNAAVATKLQRNRTAATWQILKIMYTPGSVLRAQITNVAANEKSQGDDKTLEGDTEGPNQPGNGNAYRNHHNSGKGSSRHVSGDGPGADTSGQTEDDSDSANTDHESTITNIASELAQGDFFFGDGEMELYRVFDYMQLSSAIPTEEDWTLPREAFNLRHPLGDGSPPPELGLMPNSPVDTYDYEDDWNAAAAEVEDQTRRLATSAIPVDPPWNFTGTVVNMLNHYAERGDIQMTVSVLLVLGNKLKDVIEEPILEQWYHSYIELLSRAQLWNVANQVIKLCPLVSVSSMNQQSTSFNALCGTCQKPMSRLGYFCENCKKPVSYCSYCHQTVKGIFVWCQGCGHGGHVDHMKQWFKEFKECPTGCGHLCEYT